jgi:dienelactone hydrolase
MTRLLAVVLSLTATAADPTGVVEIRDCLVLSGSGGGGGRTGRTPFAADPVALALVRGTFETPKEGQSVELSGGRKAAWRVAKANADGNFAGAGFGGSYALATVPSETERVMILDATGHGSVLVNDEPRAGDVYGYGYVKLPVLLKKGDNRLLFQTGRGRLKARLVPPRAAAQIETADATLPDLVVGRKVDDRAAVVVVNTTAETARGLVLRATVEAGTEVATPVPPLPPLSTRKVGFRLDGPAPSTDGKRGVRLTLTRDDAGTPRTLDSADLALDVRRPEQTRKETFVSSLDGSVQYYGLVPAGPPESVVESPGLILTLHGASVEGIGQARVYSPKPWAHVVAPTNRRPYGFDWEDWGRLDAIEVLDLARAALKTDPRKTYLTGHSMGGHGTWHLGVNFPDRWAAIAPSAGWVSMVSYAGARPVEGGTSVADLLRRPTAPSDTLALAPNLGMLGVYVLHGSADDNVPVGQARTMRKELGGFHPDFAYHEQPGAGHWWGNECCDWPPLVEFLRRHELPRPADVKHVDFVTASPGVSSRCHWATIEAQTAALKPSAVHLDYDPAARKFSGTTDNVACLALDLGHVPAGTPVSVRLDGQTLGPIERTSTAAPTAWFQREKDKWAITDRPSPALKGPRRGGPFKDAFRNTVVFVYGTTGTPEESAWSLARARYDAERFWYQGNASIDVVPDTAFAPDRERDRNVIVYGHSGMNAAWASLLGQSPVQVSRGKVTLGETSYEGDDLAALFVRPRPGSDVASVGVVAGTGPAGLRLSGRFPYVSSGVAYPDCFIADPKTLEPGADHAGFFGNDWSLATGEFAGRD